MAMDEMDYWLPWELLALERYVCLQIDFNSLLTSCRATQFLVREVSAV